MISYITEVSLCWAGFYLLYTLWLRKETFFHINRWYLLSTLLIGLFIPLIDLAAIFNSNPDSIKAAIIEPITITVQAFENRLAEIVVTPQNEGSFNFQALFVLIYWLGVSILGFRFFYGLFKIYLLKRNGLIVKNRGYYLVKTPKSHLPFSFFNYLFWSEKIDFQADEAEKILKHELTHIQEGHSFDVILVEVMSIFLWCSPLIFLYKSALRNIHEYLADAAVLQNTPTHHYGRLLLRQSMSGLRIVQANNLIHSQLKKRIKMMTKNKSRQRSLFKYFSIIPIAFLLVLILANKNEATTEQALSSTAPFATVITEVDNISEQSKALLGDPDEMPRFAGCEEVKDKSEQKKCSMDKLIEFMIKEVKYPDAAKKAGIEGTVVIGFTVKADGSLSDFEVAKSLESSCDAEALRVFQMMPNWIPGKKDGKAVAVSLKLPMQFKLAAQTDSKASVEGGKEIFKVAEEMPRFPGCEDMEDSHDKTQCAQQKMLQYIFGKIKYPAEARELGIQGTVIVQFIIEQDGSISGTKIKRAVGSGCDEEVIRVVNSMPRWTPGKQGGEKVRVEYVLPVKFQLDADADVDNHTALLKKLEKADKEYYLLVDGKEVDDISTISPDEIATVNVYKGGEEAILKYGPKAKIDVISIRLKKGQKQSLYSDIPPPPPPPPPPFMPKGFEGFNELQLDVFKIYPNPSNGMISLEIGTIDRVTNVIVADASGKVISIQKITDLTASNIRLSDIDISKAAKGNVFVIVDQGGKKITQKVILQ